MWPSWTVSGRRADQGRMETLILDHVYSHFDRDTQRHGLGFNLLDLEALVRQLFTMRHVAACARGGDGLLRGRYPVVALRLCGGLESGRAPRAVARELGRVEHP